MIYFPPTYLPIYLISNRVFSFPLLLQLPATTSSNKVYHSPIRISSSIVLYTSTLVE